LVGATATPAPAEDVTEAELMQAATALAQQYDANYAAKNPAGMPRSNASDGVLVAPSGSIVRGRQALTTYYAKPLASGAGAMRSKSSSRMSRECGYALPNSPVTVPGANGNLREQHGKHRRGLSTPTPMDGTCARRTERAGVGRPIDGSDTACRLVPKFSREQFKNTK